MRVPTADHLLEAAGSLQAWTFSPYRPPILYGDKDVVGDWNVCDWGKDAARFIGIQVF